MKVISLHVPEKPYEELKEIAAKEGRPVAALIREAMADYVARGRRTGKSVLDVKPYPGGRQIRGWTRSEIWDEIYRR